MLKSPKIRRPVLFAACAVIVLLVSAVIVTVLLLATRTQAPASDTQTKLTGEAVCLPHKNADGPHTLECAYGLRTDDNRYYALQFPENAAVNVEVGKRIEVTGKLTTSSSEIYDIVGNIKVESYN